MQLIETIIKLAKEYRVGTILEEVYDLAATLLKGVQLQNLQPALAGIGNYVYLMSADGGVDGIDRKVTNPPHNLGNSITPAISSNEPEPKDRSFEERAGDFLRDLEKEEGFVMVYRESGHNVFGLKIGIGKHEGLVFKNGYVFHAQKASEFYDELIKYFKERGYEPWSYELVKPNFIAVGEERVGVVQDYFKEPTLNELMKYLAVRDNIINSSKLRKLGRGLSPQEIEEVMGRHIRGKDSELRCKQLLDEPLNNGITLDDMVDVEREFMDDADHLDLSIKQSNVIVLGKRKSNDLERIGLAIIDY